jgi:nicotinate phosphoribosyltransferase
MTATSNPELAIETGTAWAGTHPHEGPLLELGIALATEKTASAVRNSQNTFFRNWWSLFPYPVRVALPDTLGDIFWQDFDPDIAKVGRGLRWDSGPWQEFNRNALNYYQRIGVNPRDTDPIDGKDAFYSDSLKPKTMLEILPSALTIFRTALFGWGTGFTNDPGGFKQIGFEPISLVMKPTAVNGISIAKLSTDPEKATGDRETIEFLREATRPVEQFS